MDSDELEVIMTNFSFSVSIIGTEPRLESADSLRGFFIDQSVNFCYNEGTSPRPRGNTRRGF